MPKIKVEGGGRCVEIEDDKLGAAAMTNLAYRTWTLLAPHRGEMGVGFGGQMVERASDQAVTGNGAYQTQVHPVTG